MVAFNWIGSLTAAGLNVKGMLREFLQLIKTHFLAGEI